MTICAQNTRASSFKRRRWLRRARPWHLLLVLVLVELFTATTARQSSVSAPCLQVGPGGATACHTGGKFAVTRGDGPAYSVTTTLRGCTVIPSTARAFVVADKAAARTVRSSKTVRCSDGQEATVTDTLTNSTVGLQWDISVSSGASGFWTAPIVSTVTFPNHKDEQYWFGGSTGGEADLGPIDFGHCDVIKGDTQPAGVCDFKYGGDYADPTTPPNEVWTNQLVLPMWAYYSTAATQTAASAPAVALVQSLLFEHVPVFARLTTHATSGVAVLAYSRELSRLGNGSAPATFRQVMRASNM